MIEALGCHMLALVHGVSCDSTRIYSVDRDMGTPGQARPVALAKADQPPGPMPPPHVGPLLSTSRPSIFLSVNQEGLEAQHPSQMDSS